MIEECIEEHEYGEGEEVIAIEVLEHENLPLSIYFFIDYSKGEDIHNKFDGEVWELDEFGFAIAINIESNQEVSYDGQVLWKNIIGEKLGQVGYKGTEDYSSKYPQYDSDFVDDYDLRPYYNRIREELNSLLSKFTEIKDITKIIEILDEKSNEQRQLIEEREEINSQRKRLKEEQEAQMTQMEEKVRGVDEKIQDFEENLSIKVNDVFKTIIG